MILEDTIAFFQEVPPLCFLPRERLAALAQVSGLEFYPAGSLVLGPGGAGNGYVHVVKKGVLRIGRNLVGPGAVLGWRPVIAQAEQDALCCLLPPEALAKALADRAELEDFLADRFTAPVLEMGLTGLLRERPAPGGRPLAVLTAGEAATGREARVGQDTPVARVAKLMTKTGQNAMLVMDGHGCPAGVVTDRDFRAKVLAAGLTPSTPVSAIMTQPVISVPGEASCFEALLAMTRHCVHQVVVMGPREALGLFSARQLMLLQTGSAPNLARLVDQAETPAALAKAAAGFAALTAGLMAQGALASSLGGIVGGLRERLAARAAQLAEKAVGLAPCGYALMFLGRAAARGGPALGPAWTGLVCEDNGRDKAYFARLGEHLTQTLRLAGLTPDEGQPQAGNAAWRGELAAWKDKFDAMVTGKKPLSDQDILDFRPVHGQAWLAEALRAHVASAVALNRPFLAQLAAGLPSGPYLDLAQTLTALTGMARILSLTAGISRIGPVERVRELGRVHPMGPELAKEAEHALEYLEAWRWLGSPEPAGPLPRAMAGLCAKVREALDRFLPRQGVRP